MLHDPAMVSRPREVAALEDGILTAAGDALLPERPQTRIHDDKRLARRVDGYLRERLDEPVTIAELCDAFDVPARTLHHAFRREFGTTPKAFHKALRLDRARRLLQSTAAQLSVTEAAIRHGFFQLAHFAVDYRRMFGESPSQTLRRRPRAAG